MAPIWQFFRKKYRVYALDFPMGCNQSGSLKEVWGISEYADMVKKFIDELNIKNPNVIAHSFGGRVAIYLSSMYNDLFDKIVLVDSAGIKPKQTLKKRLKSVLFKCGKLCINMFFSGQKREQELEKFRKKYSSSDYLKLETDVMRKTFVNVINLDLKDNLKDIKKPVLLVWGENDTDTPLYMAKIMEKEIKDSGLVVLKKAGHFSYIDNSAEFNLIVDNFFRS